MIVPIDFKEIAKKTGVTKGRIFKSKIWGWVLEGHPDIDLIWIEPPEKAGYKMEKIVDNCWFYKEVR